MTEYPSKSERIKAYAPKFPDMPTQFSPIPGPLREYYYHIAMRNAKVSIGAKLNYSK